MNNLSHKKQIYTCKKCDIKYEEIPNECIKCKLSNFILVDMYCLDKILSYNTFLHLIIGGRGWGKSYETAKYCINRWLKHGEKFLIIKRYLTELQKSLEAFIKLGYLVDKKGVYYTEIIENPLNNKKKIKINHYIGDIVTVSTASRARGGEFNSTFTIVWDEYADEIGFSFKQERKEFRFFNSLIETVFRNKEGCKAFILSNNANRFLSIYQHAQVKWDHEWTYNWNKEVVAHVLEDVKEPTGSTAKWLKTTDYYDYAYKNKPMDYDPQLIETYKLEYQKSEFCFKLANIPGNLSITKINNEYAINYCDKCNHEYFTIDEINAIKNVREINYNKQMILLDLYMKKLLRYVTPEIKQEITTWVGRNLHLI